MSEVTLRQLQYFVAVVDEGSVTAAARKSRISQAAASMAVSQLERSVGVDLLIRTRSKGVAPTPAGEELAARARHILGMVRELEGSAVVGWAEMRGELRVGCSPTLAPRIIPELVEHFARNHAAVDVTFVEDDAHAVQRDAAEGRLDVAFVYSRQAADMVDHVTIAQARPHLMLASDHPLASRDELSFRDVADEWAILLDVPPSIERVTQMMRSVGVEPRLRWQSPNLETIRGLVARGLGFSFVNWRPPSSHTSDDRLLAYVPLADDVSANAIVAALPPGVRRPRRVDEAIRHLRAVIT